MRNLFTTNKPSRGEVDYFVRQEIELRRRLAEQRQAELEAEERSHARELHYMHCPKCGMRLEEILLSDVRIDKCFGCQGLWLDDGELERISRKETGFLQRLLHLFRPYQAQHG
jgi:hypothetical protein